MERYDRGDVLGEGTFGIVYAAVQRSTGRRVAIKQFKRGKFKDGVDFTALREVKLQAELKHVNVVELLDVFVANDTMNVVFELLPSNLDDVVKDKAVVLTAADIKTYMQMLLKGIAYCHEHYVLHRDLKPENLLIGPDGHVKMEILVLPESTARIRGHVGSRLHFAELMLRTPYLTGLNELDQLGKIFHALGTPTEEEWPGVSSLANFVEFTPSTALPLASIFSAASEDALDLLSKMLKYNPAERITAEEALKHPYFSNSPAPTPVEKLPSTPAPPQA
ncbi:hypothetical protein PInf_006972 [Phytophthora infestans]|nr:hypothetical protein PInf_006972 [Phytophthora infestans]